ncbi:MAG TPA: hypothetical protein VMT30_04805 [Candidatus Saccharimonadia bacterium]|nr:hypothetical protein [Candidatus Saccharimonadia bacterium]
MSESEKVVYTGHFLLDPQELLSQLPPQISGEGTTTYAHHVTKEFEPADGKEGVTPGRERTLHVTGHVVADGVHAAIVESPDGDAISTKKHPHITIATIQGIPPVRSNDVIARASETGTIMPVEPPIEIKTVEGYFDGETVHTS